MLARPHLVQHMNERGVSLFEEEVVVEALLSMTGI